MSSEFNRPPPHQPPRPPNDDPNAPQAGDSMGQGMLWIFWIGVFAVGTYFISGWLEGKHNPNQDLNTRNTSDFAEVLLKRNSSGHYVADGQINGHDVVFFLDTGATLVSIPEGLANKIGLRRLYAGQSQTANGVIDVYGTRLDTVKLGSISVNNVHGSINPHSGMGEDILLGMSFLKHLEWTQRGDTLVLRQYR